MKKVGFFGGCFNPITNAHIDLIKEVMQQENLSKVYFVPMGDLYKKQDLIPLKFRKEMLELVFANEPQIEVLDISNKDKKTDAIDTFELIEKAFPDVQRYFIMGSDNYQKINDWKDAESLKKNYKYIILDREKGKTKQISSSVVRQRIKEGKEIATLVPKPIIEYIKENNLYK